MGTETYSTMCAEKTWIDFQQDFTWISQPTRTESSELPTKIEPPTEVGAQGSEVESFEGIERVIRGICRNFRQFEVGFENLSQAGCVALRKEKTANLLENLEELRQRVGLYAYEYQVYDSSEAENLAADSTTAAVALECCDPSSRGLLKMVRLARSFLSAANSAELIELGRVIRQKEGEFLEEATLVIAQIERLSTALRLGNKELDSENLITPLIVGVSSESFSEMKSGQLVGEVQSLTRRGRWLLEEVFRTSEYALHSYSTMKSVYWLSMAIYGIGAGMLVVWYWRSLVAVTVAMQQVSKHPGDLTALPTSPFLSIQALGEEANVLASARSREFNRITDQKKRESEIAGAVAHEYGNNSMVIEGLLRMAMVDLRAGKHDVVGAYLDKAIGACNDAKEIVAPLRESGQSVAIKKTKGISLKRDLEEEASNLATDNSQPIALHLNPECSGVRVDENDFLSIIRNLLLNAQDSNSKANRSGISLSTYPLERLDSAIVMGLLGKTKEGVEFICIEVKDEGVGIPEEIGNKIFDLGYSTKSDQERKKQPGAKGCGLHIVWNKVKENAGVIDFVRNAGGGVTFRVFLPKALDYEIELPTEIVEEAKSSLVGGEVLLVEDNPQVREVVEIMLEARGYLTTAVPSAEAALIHRKKREGNNPFGTIISDINLGIDCMSGFDLVTELRLSNCYTPVLLITAYHTQEISTELDPDVHKFTVLEKPFTPADLYRKLDLIARFSIEPPGTCSDTGPDVDSDYDLGEPVSV